MIPSILKLLLAFHLLFPGAVIPQGGVYSGGAGSGNTFTYTRTEGDFFCTGSTTCTPTITSTSAGNYLALVGVSDSSSNVITAVSGAGTWVVPGTGTITGGGEGVSFAYNLSSTSAVTSLTVTLAATSALRLYLITSSYTPGPISLDLCNTANPTISAGSFSGVPLTLTGTSEEIVQVLDDGLASAITSPYAHLTVQSSSPGISTANSVNTSSGTAPTVTTTSTGSALGAACAVK